MTFDKNPKPKSQTTRSRHVQVHSDQKERDRRYLHLRQNETKMHFIQLMNHNLNKMHIAVA